jgi:hypothetical protein
VDGYDAVRDNYARRFRYPASPFRVKTTIVTETAAVTKRLLAPSS